MVCATLGTRVILGVLLTLTASCDLGMLHGGTVCRMPVMRHCSAELIYILYVNGCLQPNHAKHFH